MKRLKLNLDELSSELEILKIDYLKGIKGGYGTPDGGDGDYGNYGGYGGPDNPIELDPVEIYGGYDDYGSGGGNVFPPGYVPPYDPGDDNYLPGMGGDDGGSGGYGGYGEPLFGPGLSNGIEVASLAIANGLAFSTAYTTLEAWRLGGVPTNTNDFLKNALESNPVRGLIDDLQSASKFNGIAILSTAGRVLGATQAVESLTNLGVDILDGGGVSMMNVADAAISVGSLFIKSNLIGVTVSFGWLLIKGEFE
ncbi:hypothetical protein [Albibacterium profundi]|uniref:Uncharacterized protein n=1 Tax=Albibacterium profundi TaxID=3134906 RepID=A0ABV5CDU0_9SPHI